MLLQVTTVVPFNWIRPCWKEKHRLERGKVIRSLQKYRLFEEIHCYCLNYFKNKQVYKELTYVKSFIKVRLTHLEAVIQQESSLQPTKGLHSGRLIPANNNSHLLITLNRLAHNARHGIYPLFSSNTNVISDVIVTSEMKTSHESLPCKSSVNSSEHLPEDP